MKDEPVDATSAKADDIEYRVTDSLVALKDLSKRPLVNERETKLGHVNGSLAGYVFDVDADQVLRTVADGLLAGGANSIFGFEYDNFILRDHRKSQTTVNGSLDIVHALRLICDHETPSAQNRSTVIIDAHQAQLQADVNSIFWVVNVPASSEKAWQDRYNQAGELIDIIGGKPT